VAKHELGTRPIEDLRCLSSTRAPYAGPHVTLGTVFLCATCPGLCARPSEILLICSGPLFLVFESSAAFAP